MPQSKKSSSPARAGITSPARARTTFKEPAALKRLNSSLDTAQQALVELRKDTGRDVGKGAQDLYNDLRKFVTSARRDSNKLAKALQRDFEQAQKQLAKAATSARTSTRRPARKTTARSTAARGTAKRSTAAKPSTTTRSAAK
jgi:hypothetical protein